MSTSRQSCPNDRERVIVLTFDNLGEAADLERGIWPEGERLGRHPSVTVALPRLLDQLDRHGLSATFFVEGLNCELYPEAVGAIAAHGHSLGVHGWRHEAWRELTTVPDRERELTIRATEAFHTLGVAPRGFRPPGGSATSQTHALLSELTYTWCSLAAAGDGEAHAADGLFEVNYDWDLVDAYHLMDRFADLRAGRGDPADAMAPRELGDRLTARLQAGYGLDVVILHPFLMLDGDWWQQVQRLLTQLAALRDSGRVTVLSGDALVARLTPNR